ncbi:mannan endo-1,4-beta-mannosidase [Ranunculus cassubicifolius]
MLNGTPFYANGFNAYWLMNLASDPSQRNKVSDGETREASSHGLTVARTWAFGDGGYKPLQYSPGAYNQDMFKGLDFVVSEARRYGIKLILSFVNNYENLGGRKQYVDWARNQGQYLTSEDDFYRNPVVKGFYKNHVKVISYKDDPTIMAWELINEPRCPSDLSGRTLQAWFTEMASYVKSFDRNHLLEVVPNPQKTVYIDAEPYIGLSRHYSRAVSSSNDQAQMSFLNNWLDTHIQDAQYMIRKPLLLAEFGKSSKDPGYSTYQRESVFHAVYNKVDVAAKSGGATAGSLFWQLLTEGMNSYGDGYEIVLSKSPSTANMIAQQSHKLLLVRKMYIRLRNSEKW